MIPDGKAFEAKLICSYYKDGQIVTDYKVMVPDLTISGDFRLEWVQVVQEAQHAD